MAFFVPLLLTIGGFVLQLLFAPKPKTQFGPRLSDINVPSVSPGNPIVRHWGTMKLSAQLVAVSPLKETKHVKKVGGKGGGSKQKQVTYTYSVDGAWGICRGPIKGVARIWANQKLIYTSALANSTAEAFDAAYYAEGTRLLEVEVQLTEASVSAYFFAFNNYSTNEYTHASPAEARNYILSHPLDPPNAPDTAYLNQLLGQLFDPLDKDSTYKSFKSRYKGLQVYLGYETQEPNALLQAYRGVDYVSGYRGLAYFVIDDLQLEDFGNGVPSFLVEVVKKDGTTYLAEIIRDICVDSGLNDREFNVTCGLPDVPVHGFAVTSSQAAREILEDLQKIYPIAAQETAYTLRFDWTTKRPTAIIRREDYGAFIQGEEMPVSEEITRTQDLELPKTVQFKYQEPVRNYSLNTAKASRQVTKSNLVEEIDAAIAMTRGEAKSRVQNVLLNRSFARHSYKVILPRKYVIIEPGDAIQVEDEYDSNYLRGMLVTDVSIGANGLVELTMTDHHFHPVVDANVDVDIVDDDDSISYSARTYAYLLDIPLLTDTEDDTPGFYAVLTGAAGTWSGGVLEIDVSAGGTTEAYGDVTPSDVSGANWYEIAESEDGTAHGFIMNELPAADHNVWDEVNTIRFYCINGYTLSSVTRTELIRNNFNVILVGDELIQFANAEDKGGGLWVLSDLLRGRRGTDWAVGTHVSGERVIRLVQEDLKRVTHDAALLNQPGTYHALSYGDDSADVASFEFTNTGNSLRPYTVEVLQSEKLGTDFVLEWMYRVRQNGLWAENPVTIDQPYEKYEIDVMDGDTVKRTVALTDARTWTYDSTDQTTDFGAPIDHCTFHIYQIGEIVGRGFRKVVTV